MDFLYFITLEMRVIAYLTIAIALCVGIVILMKSRLHLLGILWPVVCCICFGVLLHYHAMYYLHSSRINDVRDIDPTHVSVINYNKAIENRSIINASAATEYAYPASAEQKFKLKWVASQLTQEYQQIIEELLEQKFVSQMEINDIYESLSQEDVDAMFAHSVFGSAID